MIRFDDRSVSLSPEVRSSSQWRRLAAAQGAYYAATGIWSIFGSRSFQFITGPKTDTWLVKTVGALVIASGASLMQASRERERADSLVALGALSAAALAAIDFTYVAKRRIRPIYALDGIVEVAIVALWLRSWLSEGGAASDHWTLTSAPPRAW